jgi:hypothetical protein
MEVCKANTIEQLAAAAHHDDHATIAKHCSLLSISALQVPLQMDAKSGLHPRGAEHRHHSEPERV